MVSNEYRDNPYYQSMMQFFKKWRENFTNFDAMNGFINQAQKFADEELKQFCEDNANVSPEDGPIVTAVKAQEGE